MSAPTPAAPAAHSYQHRLPREHVRVLLAPVSRWTPLRKVRLLDALAEGAITESQIAAAHNVDVDELAQWRAEVDRHGVCGLRVAANHITSMRTHPCPSTTTPATPSA